MGTTIFVHLMQFSPHTYNVLYLLRVKTQNIITEFEKKIPHTYVRSNIQSTIVSIFKVGRISVVAICARVPICIHTYPMDVPVQMYKTRIQTNIAFNSQH